MNSKGTSAIYLLCMFVIFLIFGLATAKALISVADDANSQMDCANAVTYTDITNCETSHTNVYLYIGTIFGLAGILIGRVTG